MNERWNPENTRILALLDELIIQKRYNEDLTKLQDKINSLSDQDLAELLEIYSSIRKYEYLGEQKQIPEFYLYRISDYYQRLKESQKDTRISLPKIVIRLFDNTLTVIEHSLKNISIQTVPLQTYRNNSEIKGNKVILEEELQDKKIQFSFIPQEQSVLLSIFIQNLTGQLTLKLQRSNHIIDIKHFPELKWEERINIENLKEGEYVLEFSGCYNNKFGFKITD